MIRLLLAIIVIFIAITFLSSCTQVNNSPSIQSPASTSQPANSSTVSPVVSSIQTDSYFSQFQPTTVRDVPSPAPVPWSDVVTYTEQTYHIEAKVGEEFAIGMFASSDFHFMESHDSTFISKLDDHMVEYQPSTLNNYGTDWFLFKTLKTGDTELVFQYPLEYTKLFDISIK